MLWGNVAPVYLYKGLVFFIETELGYCAVWYLD